MFLNPQNIFFKHFIFYIRIKLLNNGSTKKEVNGPKKNTGISERAWYKTVLAC